ncbi:T6SS phospholipase effector Tle1-like catalytic domain-containing protein [Paraherbaspirillum soli]|uniref:T6SS phospholipase effector Tle1-like catalytic domain-containing protein n=1 Tax=Paraherbaspirillum soli TaxID=631222 RepID=A0ABW0M6H5_9BURK
MNAIDSAHNPEIDRVLSRERPLSNRELMQRIQALCAQHGQPDTLSCSGNLFVGMFFDGTGNNEDNDYKKYENDPSKQKHSNVVRLYHAYPSRKIGTNTYIPYYIPGVGTPFPQIGDDGAFPGGAMAWNGEARIIWGLTRVFNAVHFYHSNRPLIPDDQAKTMTDGLAGVGSLGWQRRHALKQVWQEKLKAAIEGRKPEIRQINLSVFGFSRGAAEARTFVNWLYEICEQHDGGWRFAGIPLRIQFMGLFDTVAAVGLAGMYSFTEGRQSWADQTMQIHPAVEQCLHFVAAHEVRACFPADSVRIDGRYPPNAKEYVYPGAHSDVGGGYQPRAQGKMTGLARIPGYDMYRAARIAGVPLTAENKLKEEIKAALLPHPEDIEHFQNYCRLAAITPGPVEDMVRQHMSWYFSYRWQSGISAYAQRTFFQLAKKAEPKMTEFLLDTQQSLMNVLAGLGQAIDARINSPRASKNAPLVQPYSAALPFHGLIAAGTFAWKLGQRINALDDFKQDGIEAKAAKIRNDVGRWRRWLEAQHQAEVQDSSAVERETLQLVDALKPEKLALEIAAFFDFYVHDSMAGFASDNGVHEFKFNGYGIAKFRRIYFGNRGDAMTREAVERRNKDRIAQAGKKHSDRARWDLEAAEHARMVR